MIAGLDNGKMFEGLKIVDLSSVVFGPYCTQIMADLGAEVIKIESPEGDVFRHAAKPAKTKGMGPAWLSLNRGKKSVLLDLKQKQDQQILRHLLSEADIFIHNIRKEAIERLGFDYDAVKALNPEIIYMHCVGFGSEGPYAGLPAYDDVIQAASGITTLHSRVDGDPRPIYIPSLIADKVAGLHAAYATMAALVHKLRSGEGQHVEVPMFEAFAHFTLKEHLGGLTFDPPVGEACYPRQVDPMRQPFKTRDGYISVAAYGLQDFPKIIRLLGDAAFLDEERFSTPRGLFFNSAALYERIGELLERVSTDEAMQLMQQGGLPAMPVRDIADMLEEPHLQQAGFFYHREHPTEGMLYEMREPSTFSARPQPEPGHAPNLGEHTEEIKARLG